MRARTEMYLGIRQCVWCGYRHKSIRRAVKCKSKSIRLMFGKEHK